MTFLQTRICDRIVVGRLGGGSLGIAVETTIALFLFLSVFVTIFTGSVLAKDNDLFSQGGALHITADKIRNDKANGILYASGNVVMKLGDLSIRADKITFNNVEGRLTAVGNISGNDEGGSTIAGDRLSWNMEDKTSVIVNGRLYFKNSNLNISSPEIRKTGPETYKMRQAVVTTCDCIPGKEPSWSFYSGEATVTLGEFLDAWHNYFIVKGVPVLYSPYLSLPVRRKRQSGFLNPDVGFSELKGLKFDNSFYWAISKSSDATLYLDIETKRGLGEGLEYRYVRDSNSSGEIYLYHFKEKDIGRVRSFRKSAGNLSRPETAESSRWFVRYMHRELLPYNIVLKSDINIVSDDEYFVDFGKEGRRSLESVESTVSFSKGWDAYNLVAQIRYFDNLLVASNKETLQKLPEITLTRSDKRFLFPYLYLSMESSFVNFERQEGVEGQRFDIHPKVSLPLNLGGYIEIIPSFTLRETLYWDKNNPEGRFQNRNLYDASLEMTTTLVRTFSKKNPDYGGLAKLQHTLRPKLVYEYLPGLLQDRFPSFDDMDRISKKNIITYSLNSILTGKYLGDDSVSYRELVYLDIRESYDINESMRRLSSPADERRPFSNISAEIRISPVEWANITAKGKYNPYERWYEDYDTSASFKDKRGDSVDLSYRFIRNSNRYLDTSANIKIAAPLYLSYKNRFSYNDNSSIETMYKLSYRQQCWNADFSYTSRIDERLVMLTVDLLGLGRVGGLGTSFGGS